MAVQRVCILVCCWALVFGCNDDSASSEATGGRMLGGADQGSLGDVQLLVDDVGVTNDGGQNDQAVDDGVSVDPADGGMTCGTLSASAQAAKRPVDILWVIDSSPSMADEIASIEQNLNAFAVRIGQSNLDYKVLMIGSDRRLVGGADIPALHNHLPICVPPPLSGAPGCPDTDSARYVHVRSGRFVSNSDPNDILADPVHSGDALDVLIDTYASWNVHLRPEARLHVIVVSDDDHSRRVAHDDLLALGMPADFYLHSIVNPIDYASSCVVFGGEEDGVECGCGDDRGRKYIAISEATGGLVLNLCQDDWTPIFESLDEQVNVGEDIPCMFRIPEAPGITIDFNRVNVDFVAPDGTRTPLVNVDDCAQDPQGWRYDDPMMPTRILLCPGSCGALEGDVEVEFGCESRKAR